MRSLLLLLGLPGRPIRPPFGSFPNSPIAAFDPGAVVDHGRNHLNA